MLKDVLQLLFQLSKKPPSRASILRDQAVDHDFIAISYFPYPSVSFVGLREKCYAIEVFEKTNTQIAELRRFHE